MNTTIHNALLRLELYIESENFNGYDPYDTLNSWIPFKQLGKWPAAIATQVQKRNPINIRPLLGISKEINPKAFGLFLQAYSILYKKTQKHKYLEKANYFFNWLIENYNKEYSGYCWGYNFPWANPKHFYDSYTPSTVVTAFVCRGIYEYYQITKSEKAKIVILSASNFVLKDIPFTKGNAGICYSYTPLEKDLCFNSSLLAAEILAMAYQLNPVECNKGLITSAVDWVISYQKEDGRWNYSIDLNSGKERIQIDFHQGYILESIFNIKNILNISNDIWELSISKGLLFYKEEQFFINGSSYWRLPKKYPIEIHNQAQGIITFLKLSSYLNNSKKFSSIIAGWTIDNMQDNDGHFYYQNFKLFRHKISYMRWSNAWMFLALAFAYNFGKKN